MTYDELCDWGEMIDDAARAEAAEEQIASEQQIEEEKIAEQMARGLICIECGSPLVDQHHRPTRCGDCGGDGETSPWFIAGTYYSDPSAARAARTEYIRKRDALAARIARVDAERAAAPTIVPEHAA